MGVQEWRELAWDRGKSMGQGFSDGCENP